MSVRSGPAPKELSVLASPIGPDCGAKMTKAQTERSVLQALHWSLELVLAINYSITLILIFRYSTLSP